MSGCATDTYILVDAPQYLTVELDKVKNYIGVPLEDTSQDQLITCMIYSAQCLFESFTRTELTEKTFDLKINCWRNCITIYKSPLISIESVKYIDENSDEQTVDNTEYYVTPYQPYSVLNFDPSFDSPQVLSRALQITIQFKAGKTTEADPLADECIQQGLMANVAYLYENRECGCDESFIPAQSKGLYSSCKIVSI